MEEKEVVEKEAEVVKKEDLGACAVCTTCMHACEYWPCRCGDLASVSVRKKTIDS